MCVRMAAMTGAEAFLVKINTRPSKNTCTHSEGGLIEPTRILVEKVPVGIDINTYCAQGDVDRAKTC